MSSYDPLESIQGRAELRRAKSDTPGIWIQVDKSGLEVEEIGDRQVPKAHFSDALSHYVGKVLQDDRQG